MYYPFPLFFLRSWRRSLHDSTPKSTMPTMRGLIRRSMCQLKNDVIVSIEYNKYKSDAKVQKKSLTRC